MNLYIDESGSINNTLKDKPFVISVIHVLEELDKDFINEKGILRKKETRCFRMENLRN